MNSLSHSDPQPITMTSQLVRLFTNFITLISSLLFALLRVVSIEHLQRCDIPAGNAYPSVHLVPSLFGTCLCSNCKNISPELAVSFSWLFTLNIGTFSVLLVKYTTQKKFRITYYIIFVHTILNSRRYSWRKGNYMKLSKQHQWACESTSSNFQDDLTGFFCLENPKIRVYPKILRKVGV